MTLEFPKEKWLEETKALPSFALHQDSGQILTYGTDLACPDCGKIGFYGARSSTENPMYRMCKFCGLWQTVGGDPLRCNMFIHDCAIPGPIHEIVAYDWNMGQQQTCQQKICGQLMTEKVKWPAEDSKHPFNKLLIYTCINP